MLVKGTITATNTAATDVDANNENIITIFKNCASFTDWIREINNKQVDNAKDIDVVMAMYNLIEYKHNYSKSSGSLWKYCRDEPAVINGNIAEFNANHATTGSFKIKEKITGQTSNNGTKDVELMVPLNI